MAEGGMMDCNEEQTLDEKVEAVAQVAGHNGLAKALDLVLAQAGAQVGLHLGHIVLARHKVAHQHRAHHHQALAALELPGKADQRLLLKVQRCVVHLGQHQHLGLCRSAGGEGGG